MKHSPPLATALFLGATLATPPAIAQTQFEAMLAQGQLQPLRMMNGIATYMRQECLRVFPAKAREIEASFAAWPYLHYEISTSINGKRMGQDPNFLSYVATRIGPFEATAFYEDQCIHSMRVLETMERSLGMPRSYLDEINALIK